MIAIISSIKIIGPTKRNKTSTVAIELVAPI